MRLAMYLVLAGAGTHAQDVSSINLLKRVAGTYSNLRNFAVEATTNVRYGGPQPTELTIPVSLAYAKPDKFRIETKHPSIAMLLIKHRRLHRRVPGMAK